MRMKWQIDFVAASNVCNLKLPLPVIYVHFSKPQLTLYHSVCVCMYVETSDCIFFYMLIYTFVRTINKSQM